MFFCNSVTNSNTNLLSGPQAIVAIEENFDCSKLITQQQQNFQVGTGYVIQLANPLNNTNVRPISFSYRLSIAFTNSFSILYFLPLQVYAQSDPFEIKAAGSTFPTSTPLESATATSATASGTGSADASATSKSAGLNLTPRNVGVLSAVFAGIAALF